MSGSSDESTEEPRSRTLAAFGLEPWEAGLAPVPPGKVPLIDWDSYNAAEAEYRAETEAFEAALPGRMQDAADEVNRRFADVLPDGMRFVYTYDGPLGFPPDTIVAYGAGPFPEPRYPPWTPFRNRMPRAAGCYQLASGAMVHVKPDCRCPR